MGEFEMGGGGQAAIADRYAARSSRSRSDLAGCSRPRFTDRASQLHLEPAALSRLPGRLGQHLSRPPGLPPVGRDAVRGLIHWRRDLRPVSKLAYGRAGMRLRLAAVLGATHG